MRYHFYNKLHYRLFTPKPYNALTNSAKYWYTPQASQPWRPQHEEQGPGHPHQGLHGKSFKPHLHKKPLPPGLKWTLRDQRVSHARPPPAPLLYGNVWVDFIGM